MKNKLISLAVLMTCAMATQSYGMQAGNTYVLSNHTPDATIAVSSAQMNRPINVAPGALNLRLKNAPNMRIDIVMPNNGRVAFNVAASCSISLTKIVNQNNPARSSYRLVVTNPANQVIMDRTFAPAPEEAPAQIQTAPAV